MFKEVYKARIKTANRTREQIEKRFLDDVSEQEVKEWIRVYDLIDGMEVVVAKSFISEEAFVPISWDDNEKMAEYVYQIEQDPMYGTYIDSKKEFMEDWSVGEYSPSGVLLFWIEDIEIIEKVKDDSNV